jgi:hypothetical protein
MNCMLFFSYNAEAYTVLEIYDILILVELLNPWNVMYETPRREGPLHSGQGISLRTR